MYVSQAKKKLCAFFERFKGNFQHTLHYATTSSITTTFSIIIIVHYHDSLCGTRKKIEIVSMENVFVICMYDMK